MSPPHVALVTGGGKGIGRAISRRIGRDGAFVLVAGRRFEACAAVVEEVRAEGGRAHALQLDVTDRDSIRGALDEALRTSESVGAIDWLVNNAGIAVSAPLLHQADVTDPYEEHMRVNFHGARRMVEALLPGMRAGGYGRVVNVASSAGLYGYAYVSAYCASKHALIGYTRAAALELKKTGVAIGAVCPHYVDSPMTDRAVERIVEKTGKSPEEARAILAAQNPGGRLVAAEEVAEAVWQQLSGDQNGAIVELDGTPTS
jgi:NAD(P)-dependent dehydrogenase (short-subunit alcohol dehydrogenase family)